MVAYCFGPRSVRVLARKPAFEKLTKSKRFAKVAGPDAEGHFFDEDLKDAIRQWKRDEYDNFKDALLEARDLAAQAKKLDAARAKAANGHLETVTKAVQKVMKEDPEIRSYLAGLFRRAR